MKRLLLLALAVLMVIGIASCGKKANTLEVYIDPNFPPFEFLGKDNEVVGVDAEIAKEIAKELGKEVKFFETDFDGIIMAIKGGKGDIAVSGFTIREDRKENVDFSDPYIKTQQFLILPADSEIKTIENLAGLKVGVAKNYTGDLVMGDEVNEEDGVLYGKGTKIYQYNSANEASAELKNGRADAVVMDEYVAKAIVSANTGLKTIPLQYEDGEFVIDEYGVVVPKGNEELLKTINSVIKRLNDAGQIEKWLEKYLDEFLK